MKRLSTLSIFILFTHILFSQNENGYVKFYYPNGKISSEGIMVNGKPDNFWKTYYVTGIIKSEGNRKNYKLDSLWIFYTETADTLEKINYLAGKRNGYSFLYQTLTEKNSIKRNFISSKELYVNDSKEGLSYYYHSNGNLRLQIYYKNNKKHGQALEYDINGTPITVYEYFNDYLVEKTNINRVLGDKQEGIWRTYYPSGKIKKEEVYKEGQLNGYTKEYNEQENVVNSALFRDGLMVDKKITDSIDLDEVITKYPNGKLKSRSFLRKGVMIGTYREYDTTGSVILSKVYSDQGILLSNGIIKDDGSREGRWNYFYPNGALKSSGEFKNNRQQGEWKFFFGNGANEQIGTFSNGALTGKWTWYYSDSVVEKIENFSRSKLNGEYYEFSKTGDTLVSGNYIDGLKSGLWKIRVGDITEIGNYSNDLKEGIWKSYYLNNQLMYQGNYINGLADGKHLFYYDNGYLKEEQFYVNGYKEKVWKKYDTEGRILLAVTYSGDAEVRINGIRIDKVKYK